MSRRIPFSPKKRKAQLMEKRAIKRGDLEAPPPTRERHRKGVWPDSAPATTRSHVADPDAQQQPGPSATDAARRLQSSFVKLPKEFLQETKRLAAVLPLPRPISPTAAVWEDVHDAGSALSQQLTCPKRPVWRYEMSKKEVERNEEGNFAKWLDQTDTIVNAWCAPESLEADGEQMPKAPTSFEHNLEVWRQLWRVTEISQIVLILLDSRCPLLHYPPSLAAYLSTPHFVARKRTILVLTKVDIAGPERANAWTKYLNARYPELRVVQVEAYSEKSAGRGAGGRRLYEPHLPSAFRQTLVDALRDTHADLLRPPEKIRDVPEKVKMWNPPVKREVNWEAVLNAQGGQVGSVVGGAAAPRPRNVKSTEGDDTRTDLQDNETTNDHEGPHPEEDEDELEFLTIGLIGQPNVGKSSLLNALFGTQKAKASHTPGKTKHFQTLFWTPEVRLVDCPGLVMPNLVPMETQVLSGILPISRVSAVPLCIYHAARLLPLETIFSLEHPALSEPVQPDKRTWREPRAISNVEEELQAQRKAKAAVWTAMDILTAFATKKGWMTAKTGWPDTHRAGNFILRAIAEGKVKWAFWPPDTPLSVVQAHQARYEDYEGIWLTYEESYDLNDPSWYIDSDDDEHRPTTKGASESNDEDSDELETDDDEDEEEMASLDAALSRLGTGASADEDEEEDEEDEDEIPVKVNASRFNALALADDAESDED